MLKCQYLAQKAYLYFSLYFYQGVVRQKEKMGPVVRQSVCLYVCQDLKILFSGTATGNLKYIPIIMSL